MCNDIFITALEDSLLKPSRIIEKINLNDRGRYTLVIACGLKASESAPAFIETDTAKIPVLDKYANEVYTNQLSTRYRYCLAYGNRNDLYPDGQFIILNNLCYSCPSSRAKSAKKGKEV